MKWKDLSSKIISENEHIVLFAEKLSAMGIKSKDALHISCAIYGDCEYFITTDRKLLNIKINETKIISPIDFIIDLEV